MHLLSEAEVGGQKWETKGCQCALLQYASCRSELLQGVCASRVSCTRHATQQQVDLGCVLLHVLLLCENAAALEKVLCAPR
jgi:hypothetical protein